MTAAEVIQIDGCPICGTKCYGRALEGAYLCGDSASAGDLPQQAGGFYRHTMAGACECGVRHDGTEGGARGHRLRFSVGRDVKPSRGTPHDHEPAEMSVENFAARLAEPQIGPKGSAGFYLPAVFAHGKRTKSDSIEPPSLVSVDLDFGEWSLDSIDAAIPSDTAWIAYSTASHTPEEPRYRVVLPLGETLSVAEWILLSRGVMRWFGYEEGVQGFDKCTEKIAQPMYLPTIGREGDPFEARAEIDRDVLSSERIAGIIEAERRRIDLAEGEAKRERERRNEERRRKSERFGHDAGEPNVIEAFNAQHPIEEMLERCGYQPPRAPGGRWLSPNSSKGVPAVKVWVDEGRFYSHHGSDQGTDFEQGDAFDLFRLFDHGGDWTEAVKAAASELGIERPKPRKLEPVPKRAADEPPAPPSHLPQILINTREARDVVSDILFAIQKRNDPPTLFSRIGSVVRVARNDFGVGEAREVEPADMLNVVSAAADFVRWDGRARENVIARPPRELYAAAFARMSVEETLPRLRTVTPTPVIHEDGRILAEEGYDPKSRAYFAPSADFELGHVPDEPTESEAQRAVEALMAPFRDLPFDTDTDAANFLALLVTVVVRSWFPTVPFAVIEAPVQGSGKTLAAMAVRMIAEGTAGIGAAPEEAKQGDSEWRKRITSILLSAPAVSIIDNVTGTLGGATLAALATSPVYSDRLLGTNKARDLPNVATWVFTSNNAQVDADLLRRCLFVRLDPRSASPHLRSGFEIPDLIGHLEQRRGEILAAIYTIVRRWIVLGKPDAPEGTPVLGSFERWSRTVPAILGAVGVIGVLGDVEERNAMMRDPDEEDAAEFLSAWWEGFPALREGASAKDLVEAALASDAPGREELPVPAAVMHGKGRDSKPAVLARSLGRWIKFRRDRIVPVDNAVAFTIRLAGGNEKRGFRWNVERIDLTGGES